MPTQFLNPPPGPTQLRAPRRDEGADILGNIAGNDPNLLGQLAQQLMKLREPLGIASMGMMGAGGVPPARNPINREAQYFAGLQPQLPSSGGPRGYTREADLRAAVSPEAISQRIIPMLQAKPSTPERPYTPRVPGAEDAQLAALRAQQQQLQQALSPAAPQYPGVSSRQANMKLKRENAPIDAGAILSPEEIKALMQVMRNTTPPMKEEGSRAAGFSRKRAEATGDPKRPAPGRKSNLD